MPAPMMTRRVCTALAASLLVFATMVAAAQTTPPAPPPPAPAPTPPAPAAPTTTTTCTDVASCTAACNDGEGSLAACALAGDGLYWGRNNTAPDRAKALRFFRAACGLSIEATPTTSGPRPLAAPKPSTSPGPTLAPPPPPSRGSGGTDFVACKAAANLHAHGWLFEVEADARLAKTATDRAYTLAVAHCTDKDQTGCAVASWAARDLATPGQADAAKDPVKLAEKGCTVGKRPESCVVLRDLAFRGMTDAESQRIQTVSNSGLVAACTKDGNLVACQKVSTYATPADSAAVIAAAAKSCTAGNKLACGIAANRTLSDNYRDIDKAKAAAKALADSCSPEAHELCTPVARLFATGDTRLGITADPAMALAIGEKRCMTGDIDGCRIVASLRSTKGPEATRDAAKASELANRSCSLSLPTSFCGECRDDPTLAECRYRDAFREHQGCLGGTVGACERAAGRFKSGDGVSKDLLTAASYLRRGCDSAEKSACIALDTACIENPELPVDVCAQALIHSDLFYEAEYQMSAGGDVDLVDPEAVAKPESRKTPGSVSVADVAAQMPTKIARGKLDADLVVDVVLDRARQAAIRLVVDELLTAERKARYRYLRDLLDQGARLLADPSTLRREKFQDLGMTVVRAFVASNLIDGLYPNTAALLDAKEIGPTVTKHQKALGVTVGTELSAVMHGYLVDVAYYWLGNTRLFGQPSQLSQELPVCPWGEHPLCTQLNEKATAERAIGVDKVLDGLRLAKALRDGGFEDIRRLIEASSRSRTIANLASTPGLTLDAWQRQLVQSSRSRLDGLRESLSAMRALTRASAYAETGVDLAYLKEQASAARGALGSPAIRIGLGQDNIDQVLRIVRLIERADRELTTGGGGVVPPAGSGSPSTTPGGLDLGTLVMTNLRKDVTAGFVTWGPRYMVEFSTKITTLEKTLDGVLPALDRLEAAIADVRALFSRFPAPDGSFSLDVDNIPLYASGDLARELRAAQTALVAVDQGLHTLFPGEVQAQLRFARTATARLIGFLDLMERVARSSALTSRSGDVISALRLLGSYRIGVFDAPLYDVLEPVIDSIRTHEPMSLELLFAVIGHVRLDTLIGALQGKGNACAKETSVDCWTTKLIHALQESVERTGDELRIDGGKFAERLAQHGDDFRKKHTWRGYFHLTVGVGALNSDAVDDGSTERRNVPLLAEQVGVGYASPSFFGDRLSFKVGAAASGLLYRAVLDSEESNAVMVHPIFLALDIGELVEIYVSPAMLLLYPPTDTNDGTIRWGIAAGVQVPLSAYLERL